jgi:hypothetical protein
MGDDDDRDQFLACIRAMRADYCGDGNSYTQHGTNIEVYDNDTPRPSRGKRERNLNVCGDGRCYEAMWSKDRAVVFNTRRWAEEWGKEGDWPCGGTPPSGPPPGTKNLVITRAEVNFCKDLPEGQRDLYQGTKPNRKSCKRNGAGQRPCP